MRKNRLSYLGGKRLMAARNEPRYVVRVFHPKGQYPRCRITQPNAMFWADDNIVFSVTLGERWQSVDVDMPYTEMDWLTPNELRFLGSIFLCELWDEAKIRFYPVSHYAPVINRKKLDFTKQSTVSDVRDLVLLGLCRPKWTHNAAILQECIKLRYALIPPDEVGLERQPLFWEKISPKDHVLLRGLSALFKSDMLSCYYEFIEEATISCFIALEASFRLITDQLVAKGHAKPTAKDAALWLHNNFDVHFGLPAPVEKYFEEFYNQRIMTLHPSSRFGEHLYAPLMVDDLYHLRSSLRSIFAYLVLGKHDRGFIAEMEKHKRHNF